MDIGLVCDACSAFSKMGSVTCVSCNQILSLDGKATLMTKAIAAKAQPQPPAGQNCKQCNTFVSKDNRFCGSCGTPTSGQPTPGNTAENAQEKALKKNQTLFFGNSQAVQAKLVLIKGEGYDGESYVLAGTDHRIGRSNADISFEEDPFLSPVHANFYYVAGKLFVKDEGSTNGVYLRIKGSCHISNTDCFLVGEQVIQVRPVELEPALQPTPDGTYLYSSPSKSASFQLGQIIHGGSAGLSLIAENNRLSLGREDSDINFPDDPFISGHHAEVIQKGKELTLNDLGSKNGTFIRITKETPLEHGDYVFMGQQLLRVEIV